MHLQRQCVECAASALWGARVEQNLGGVMASDQIRTLRSGPRFLLIGREFRSLRVRVNLRNQFARTLLSAAPRCISALVREAVAGSWTSAGMSAGAAATSGRATSRFEPIRRW